MDSNKKLALRMDDVGASSKLYEQYGHTHWQIFGKSFLLMPIANYFFLKRIAPFKKWGPYPELKTYEWEEILALLKAYDAYMTVGITAAWVEKDGKYYPFHDKFPEQAKIIRKGVNKGLLEVANHGLTHCIVNKHLPRFFSSNRKYHREFYSWIPKEVQEQHIRKSQEILQNYFKVPVETFIPPGNIICEFTVKAAERYGIKYISCYKNLGFSNIISVTENDGIYAFHDRELVVNGVEWLRKLLKKNKDKDKTFVFVKEIGQQKKNGIKKTCTTS